MSSSPRPCRQVHLLPDHPFTPLCGALTFDADHSFCDNEVHSTKCFPRVMIFFFTLFAFTFFFNSSASSSCDPYRYNVVTFVPVCLFQQFTRFANFWFLICCHAPYSFNIPRFLSLFFRSISHATPLAGILQTIKETSLTNQLPLTAVPLSFVLILSMLREGIEDYGRYRSDLEVLHALCHPEIL